MHRQSALILAFCLLAVPVAQAQSVTTNYRADPSMSEPARARPPSGSVLDYVMPYVPVLGPKWTERRIREEEDARMQMAPVAAPKPKATVTKKKRASATSKKRQAATQAPRKVSQKATRRAAKPVVEAKAPAPAPVAAPVVAAAPPVEVPKPDAQASTVTLRDCVAGFAAREVSRGSNATPARLLSQAAELDCSGDFRQLADVLTREFARDEARARLEAVIRDTLAPAVEAAATQAQAQAPAAAVQ